MIFFILWFFRDPDRNTPNEEGKIIRNHQVPNNQRKLIKNLNYQKLIFPHSSALFNKTAVNKIGNYRTFFKKAQDYDLWLRISENFECHHIRDKLVNCELHNNSLSNVYSIQQKGFSILAKIKAMKYKNRRYKCIILTFKVALSFQAF